MTQQMQLPLFAESATVPTDLKASRSGTFVDNIALPVHRWFRYSAGFAAEWVEQTLAAWQIGQHHLVLDPFAGSGTVPIVCEKLGISSIGVEAYPVVARICQAKLHWSTSVDQFTTLAERVTQDARYWQGQAFEYPPLIERSFDPELIAHLEALKRAWQAQADQSPAAELVWLAITAILRPCSSAGTAQWQYILPNKTKKKVLHPAVAFRQQVDMMAHDMYWMQSRAKQSRAYLIAGDARNFATAVEQKVDKEKLSSEELLSAPAIAPIHAELAEVVQQLAATRENHGGKKHYHTMVAAYCRDIALVLQLDFCSLKKAYLNREKAQKPLCISEFGQ